ncbi:acyltransferase [Flavobacterium sp. WV_118_3]|uniref:acyltransferase n=1 Tax=Flavobacterium sp. WV_118_3 TaxID=3151764 RepID=UPI00321BE3CF
MIDRLVAIWRRHRWPAEKYARFLGVKIGKNCSIATKYFGSEPYLIEIGDHVQITNDVRFFNHGGGWVFREKYPLMDTFGKIKIGNNVYIGNCVLIMPGVTIGSNVIVGAGTVVTKSIPDNSIYAGNPAREIGKISELETKILPFDMQTKKMSPQEKKLFLLSQPDEKFIKK